MFVQKIEKRLNLSSELKLKDSFYCKKNLKIQRYQREELHTAAETAFDQATCTVVNYFYCTCPDVWWFELHIKCSSLF